MDRAMLKADAKAALREARPNPYLVALVYLGIVAVLGILQSKLTGVVIDYDTYYNHLMPALQRGDFEYVADMYRYYAPAPANQLIGVLISLMSMMLGVGYIINTLHVSRREENSIGNLFDGFAMFFRVLWLQILIWLFTALWSLLFVIPGVIAALRYAQALRILIDDPSKGALQCIRESKEMMRGHKWELFVLGLSFIGWYILIGLAAGVVAAVIGSFGSNSVGITAATQVASSLLSIILVPYVQVTFSGYYNALAGWRAGAGSAPSGGTRGDDDQLPPWEYK